MNYPSKTEPDKEIWKDIPGFEGIYEASNHGRIRSAEGKTTFSSRNGVIHWKQRVLKQHFQRRHGGSGSDARVTLWKNKRPYYFLVARLIAMTWCEGYAAGMTVNHIDGNPENNHSHNLEWVSIGDNIRHGFNTGLFDRNKKPVTVLIDGRKVPFKSLAEASRALGHHSGYLSNAIKKGHKVAREVIV